MAENGTPGRIPIGAILAKNLRDMCRAHSRFFKPIQILAFAFRLLCETTQLPLEASQVEGRLRRADRAGSRKDDDGSSSGCSLISSSALCLDAASKSDEDAGMTSLVRSSEVSMRPSTAGTLSRFACARAMSAGIDVAPLMVKAGVTRQQVEDDSIRLTVQGQIRFVELISNALQDDLLGFHLARDYDLREIGLLYYVLNSSNLLGDALRRAERYSMIVNEGVSLRVHEGKELAVTFTYIGVERLSDRHQIEAWVTSLVRICRQLTNRRLLPSRVRIVHRRKGGAPELDKFLGCDVVFGADADEVAFPGTVKQMPVVNADPYLNELLIKYCEEAHSHREAGRGTFRVGLENAIAPLLPHGKARADEIARQLGMSPRTLARRLGSEGLTFTGILSELRADLAKRYLRDEGLAISEVAWLLGYQEVSAFTHAFKRWTGKTPREARAQENVVRPESASL